MKSGFQEVFAGCLVNLAILVTIIIINAVFTVPNSFAVLIVAVPIGFVYGKKIIAEFSGPNTALWLYTGDVGVSFAYLSIDLFRQDKKFSKTELERLCKYYVSEFGKEVGKPIRAFVSKNMRKKVVPHHHTAKVRNFPHKHRILFLYNLFSMAMADGVFEAEEENYLKDIAKLISVNDYYFDMIKSKFIKEQAEQKKRASKQSEEKKKTQSKTRNFSKQFFSPYASAYLTLELSKYASNEEVKKAYRNLVKKHHPDMVLDNSEAAMKEAEKKFREITQAYELIKKERGMK